MTTSVLERGPDGADWNDFFHARFYDARWVNDFGYQQRDFSAWGPDDVTMSGGTMPWHYVVGTCRVDVNELGPASYPGGEFPAPPPVTRSPGAVDMRWQWSGYSEWVEDDIADRWQHMCDELDGYEDTPYVKRSAGDA